MPGVPRQAVEPDMIYAKVDQLGLYVRFGSAKITVKRPQTWGALYFSERPYEPPFPGFAPRSNASQPAAIAFEVNPWDDVPWRIIAGQMQTTEEVLRKYVEVAMPGWAYEPQSDQ